jgi:hypothetical protein
MEERKHGSRANAGAKDRCECQGVTYQCYRPTRGVDLIVEGEQPSGLDAVHCDQTLSLRTLGIGTTLMPRLLLRIRITRGVDLIVEGEQPSGLDAAHCGQTLSLRTLGIGTTLMPRLLLRIRITRDVDLIVEGEQPSGLDAVHCDQTLASAY